MVTAITTLIQLLLSGECDAELRPYLCGGRLVPLQKKLGGIRPLVVGDLFKLLTGKVFMDCTAACLEMHCINRKYQLDNEEWMRQCSPHANGRSNSLKTPAYVY